MMSETPHPSDAPVPAAVVPAAVMPATGQREVDAVLAALSEVDGLDPSQQVEAFDGFQRVLAAQLDSTESADSDSESEPPELPEPTAPTDPADPADPIDEESDPA
jgi:hypothetical protein